DDLVELLGAPAADRGAGMQQHLHEANHAGVVDLDAGILGGSKGNRQCQALQEREVDMRVQAAGLEGGEAVGNAEELLAHVAQMFEPLPESEVGQAVAADLMAQDGGNL